MESKSISVLTFTEQKSALQLKQEFSATRPDVQWDFAFAENRHQAAQLFRRRRPHIVIVDSNLPETNPDTLSQELLNIDSRAAIFCLALDQSIQGRWFENLAWPTNNWTHFLNEVLSGLPMDIIDAVGGTQDQSESDLALSRYAAGLTPPAEGAEQKLTKFSWIPKEKEDLVTQSNGPAIDEAKPQNAPSESVRLNRNSLSLTKWDTLLLLISAFAIVASFVSTHYYDFYWLEALKWLVAALTFALWTGFFFSRLLLRISVTKEK